MNIIQIGKDNFKKYFLNRINAVPPGSIRLKPAFITKKSSSDYDKLENQLNSEILQQIKGFISKIEFEDSQEKNYYENKASKTTLKKCELVEMHAELSQMLQLLEENDGE